MQAINKKRNFFNLKNVAVVLLIIYFAIFLVYPIYKAFAGSLHDWNPMIDKYDFVGLDNFKDVLTSDLFWKSMSNTFVFTFFAVLFRVVLGLGLALLISSKLTKAKTLFQGLFYMPTITPLVAVSFVWMWMFDPQFGLINKVFHLDINWLKDTHWALPAIIIMTIWKDFGYATVLFLGGLMGLPEDVFEAAEIDGATSWQTFWKITVPLLKPTTLFVVITSLITYLQAYIQILIMTDGGPGTSTYVISYLIYDEAFVKYNFGSASAMAIILFVIIGILTIIMFKVTGEGKKNQ
ncbi:sugar ABC transporter permease [Enterococcus sp. MJM12]|uniref:Sugar ABC transporter permease n=1 Tax=Candidatus Enterococcus myersii TaxID=2815322 RepID=A0ABS3H3I7_9ENTE|nr:MULTISPECIES: sugar ABC transporter permease [Enterococcus]MBO0447991.1 sugar ABC transporter permease [Enterococcus sp. MJM12]MDT2740141.1 sugar ABC transporter permease [Enterococcus canintestini]WHA08958.1 sugar ABC transporter permease [Enterococcus montenegrensis]